MKLVCDTNVLVAAAAADGLCRDIVKRRLPLHELFTSTLLLEELEEVLRSKFAVEPARLPLLRAYRERAGRVAPADLRRRICRDPDDDFVLATAVAARADAILTGDDDLLTLKRFRGILILSPRDFVRTTDRA